MKTKIYFLTFATVAFLLTSCGSLSITQKRYSRGLNISLFRSKDEKPVAQKATIAHKNQTNKTNISSDVSSTPVADQPVETTGDKSLNEINNNNTSKIIGSDKNENAKPKAIETKIKSRAINKFMNTIQPNKITQTSNDSDVALIILILLALFIPPLAVYLYYGEINTQFWISLILTLLAGGIFFVGSSIGWGFPVVHALLVILGIFD